jgi:hypothetical protein
MPNRRNPDAELLELGKRLRPIEEQWESLRLEEAQSAEWDDFLEDRMWPLVDRILACTAQSLAGFQVQIRALYLATDGFEDMERHELKFIASACGLTGLSAARAVEKVAELDGGDSVAVAGHTVN